MASEDAVRRQSEQIRLGLLRSSAPVPISAGVALSVEYGLRGYLRELS
jgi:hypothetical protein